MSDEFPNPPHSPFVFQSVSPLSLSQVLAASRLMLLTLFIASRQLR
jgi:hypothetical protein